MLQETQQSWPAPSRCQGPVCVIATSSEHSSGAPQTSSELVCPTVHTNPCSVIPGSCHLLSLILLLVLPPSFLRSKLTAFFHSKQRVDLPFLHSGWWYQQISAWLGSCYWFLACYYSGLSLNVTSSGKHLGSRSILSAIPFPCYTFSVAYLYLCSSYCLKKEMFYLFTSSLSLFPFSFKI